MTQTMEAELIEDRDDRRKFEALSLLEGEQVLERFCENTLNDSLYGVILRYLERGELDFDLTAQLKNLLKAAANKYRVRIRLL